MVLFGPARCGRVRKIPVWQGEVGHGKERSGRVRQGFLKAMILKMMWMGLVRQGGVWCGDVWLGLARWDRDVLGKVASGVERFGMAGFCWAW